MLIALGRIDDDLLNVVNDVIKRRKETRQKDGMPHHNKKKDDRLKGVQHKVSEAKKARTEAKRKQKLAEAHPRSSWLQEAADKEWAHAEKLSVESGFTFTDRKGKVITGAKSKQLVEEVLEQYLPLRGLQYE